MIWRWGPPALLSLVCMVAVSERLLDPPPTNPRAADRPAAPAEASALLGELRVGDTLAGWTVLGITGPTERALRIDVARDDLRFSITLAPRGTMPYASPRSTERYDLFYGHPHPRGAEIPQNAVRAIMAGIERRVRRNEGEVEVPGL